MGILLFIVACILLFLLSPLFIIYALFRSVNISKYFHNVAFSIDQLGNVMGSPIMNDLLLKKGSLKLYGDPDETISYVTGVNYKAKTLTSFGYFIAHTLDFIDKDHVEKASNSEQ